ncbi:hypothetical protein V5R04_08945 [Jonesiaceae bacterium BS-20]|uniref:Uncharacterized protein n=1 Tax=Jonesiaceae bacterium BS-20 TaxID=3120821 RepID=A0AAU7DR05_9MICO
MSQPTPLSVTALSHMVGLRSDGPAQPVQWTEVASPDPTVAVFSGVVTVGRAAGRDQELPDAALTTRNNPGLVQIPCLLLRPKGEGPRQAVVAIHQHNDEHHLGKSEPAGLAGNPNVAYGLELAKQGFLVAVPDLLGFEDRGSAHGRTGRELELFYAMNAIANGHSLHGEHVSDVLAVANYLENHELIVGNVAVTGHSLGAQIGLLVLALAPNITVGVISAGLTSIAACKRADVLHNAGWYLPGLETAGDYGAIAAMITGKKALSIAATDDEHFPTDGAQDVLGAFPEGVLESHWRSSTHEMDRRTLDLMTNWMVANHGGAR